MSVGIKDIAKKANVSIATVSLVLNNKSGVSAGTRKRVMAIVEELGYRTNLMGKPALLNKGTIRFIVFHLHGKVVTDTPFFAALIGAIDTECKKDGLRLVVSYITQADIAEELRIIQEEQALAGLIILATEMDQASLEQLTGFNIPVVILDSYYEMMPFNHVVINNYDGVSQAVHYLYQKGHRDIGYCRSSVFINNFEERSHAFYQSTSKLGLTVPPAFEYKLSPSIEGAYSDMLAILQDGMRLPTALFADNDLIALGALKALKEKGYAVPEDISIIGFDDLPYCEIAEPRLTTVRVFNQSMGKQAVQRLKQMNDDDDADTYVKIEVGTKLNIRDSVAEI